jgi:microcystin-dependent protein
MSSLNALKITKDNLEYNTDEKQNTVTTDIGTILLYAGTTINNISNNFLLCDGTSHEIGDYPELFGVIGDKYGGTITDGTITHFNVPNFKLRIPIGPKENVNTINYQGAPVIQSGNDLIEDSQMKHSHSLSGRGLLVNAHNSNYDPTQESNSDSRNRVDNTSRIYNDETSNNLDGNNETNGTRIKYYPKYTSLNYIICYKT